MLYKWGGLSICTGLLVAAVLGAAVRTQPSNRTELKATTQLSSVLKPVYHLTAESGWMNDPNGMLFHNGIMHVFYQLNPFAPRWAAPWWGHVVSKDFAHYKRLEAALAPELWFDEDGVFSGSAMLDDEGVPRLLYTGVTKWTNSSYPYYYQRQGWAVPSQPSDPFLTNWTRPTRSNPLPVDPPPGGNHEQFRDPITPWKVTWRDLQPAFLLESPSRNPTIIETTLFGNRHKGKEVPLETPVWLTAIGVQDDCIGAAALYASGDLEKWEYVGTLFSQLAQNISRYQGCLLGTAQDVPKGARQFGKAEGCDQFGMDCHMWECPDFFNVTENIFAFKYSDQVKARTQFSGDWYVLGDGINYTAAAFQDGQDAFQAVVGGDPVDAVATDYGTVYASKSFQAGSRRLWYGWVFEDSLGCDTMCGDGSTFTQQMGWQGAQTLPRQILYDPETKRLRFEPVPETQLLRESKLFDGNFSWQGGVHKDPAAAVMLELSPGEALPRKASSSQPLSGGRNRNMEILASFSVTCGGGEGCDALPTSWSVDLGLVIKTGKLDYTVVKLTGNGPVGLDSLGTKSLDTLSVYVDKMHSGGATRPGVQGGLVDRPAHGHALDQPFKLHVFVDGSIVEVYAMNGRGRVTSRIYPLDDQAVWDVGVFGVVQDASTGQPVDGVTVRVDAVVYDLHSCWVQDV